MALARARLRPSTVSSTVVPRTTPTGTTELSVGGVMRLPDGWLESAAASTALIAKPVNISLLTRAARNRRRWSQAARRTATVRERSTPLMSRNLLTMIHPVDFECAIKARGGEGFSVGREREAEDPVRLCADRADFGKINRAEKLDRVIRRRGRNDVSIG